MLRIFIPIIRPQDYEAFRDILGSRLPDSYDGWLHLCADWREINVTKGDTVSEAEVDPNKFARHLARTGHPPDLKALLAFTEIQIKAHENDS